MSALSPKLTLTWPDGKELFDASWTFPDDPAVEDMKDACEFLHGALKRQRAGLWRSPRFKVINE